MRARSVALEVGAWAFISLVVWFTLTFACNAMEYDDWPFALKATHILQHAGFFWTDFFFCYHAHVPAVLSFLFWGCIKFFNGNLRYLLIFNLLTLLCSWLIGVYIIRRTVEDPRSRGGLQMASALIIFSPAIYFLLYAGWGSAWLLIPMLLLGAMALSICEASIGWTFLAYFLLALTGSLVLGHGFLLWMFLPVLLVARFGLAGGGWRLPVLWTLGAIGILILYFTVPNFTYAPGEYNISPTATVATTDSLKGVRFTFDFWLFLRCFYCLVGSVSRGISTSDAVSLATCGLLLGAYLYNLILAVSLWVRGVAVRGAFLWLYFGLYQLAAILMVALVRSHPHQIDPGAEFQYMDLSVCLFLSVTLSSLMLLQTRSSQVLVFTPKTRRYLWLIVGVTVLLALVVALFGFKRMTGRAAYRHNWRAQIALEQVIPFADPAADCHPMFTPKNIRDYLDFHVFKIYSVAQVQSMLDQAESGPLPEGYSGRITSAFLNPHHQIQLQGWVGTGYFHAQPDAVLVTYPSSPNHSGYACFWLFPSLRATLSNPSELVTTWSGTMAVEPEVSSAALAGIHAYALVIDRDLLIPLKLADHP